MGSGSTLLPDKTKENINDNEGASSSDSGTSDEKNSQILIRLWIFIPAMDNNGSHSVQNLQHFSYFVEELKNDARIAWNAVIRPRFEVELMYFSRISLHTRTN